MTAFIMPFFPGVISFAIFAIVLPFAMRWHWPPSPALRLLPVAIVALPIGVVVGARLFDIVAPWHSAAAFGMLFMLLWFAFGSIAKSVTLLVSCRLLDEIEGVAIADIKHEVIESEFDTRVALLCEVGYVARTESGYAITSAGLKFLDKLRTVSSLFGIDSKGLYGFAR